MGIFSEKCWSLSCVVYSVYKNDFFFSEVFQDVTS